ncbi:hypothetical protein J8281_02445 [Aquimarina sp. U1-2]|uniref:hypothetical protein n=1 Tax=Aquimarina sp. U1-2 TaxID=2823141 RepID=UPI001AECAE61|nr:hypothetical protein [Aquimarina sp. U1-2]MBP2831035.1 hypothetical protein [Aquimarina sp. U1-2]
MQFKPVNIIQNYLIGLEMDNEALVATCISHDVLFYLKKLNSAPLLFVGKENFFKAFRQHLSFMGRKLNLHNQGTWVLDKNLSIQILRGEFLGNKDYSHLIIEYKTEKEKIKSIQVVESNPIPAKYNKIVNQDTEDLLITP